MKIKELAFGFSVCILFACSMGQKNDTETSVVTIINDSAVYPEQAFDKNLVTVYGNAHRILGYKESDSLLRKIARFQDSIYKNLTEDIIVFENLAFTGNESNKEDIISYIMLQKERAYGRPAANPALQRAKIEEVLKKDTVHEIYIRYLFGHRKVRLFGGEDSNVWESQKKLYKINPKIVTTPEYLNKRSEKILENTIKISKMYPGQKIAIIIGRRHLEWFKRQGYAVKDFEKTDF